MYQWLFVGQAKDVIRTLSQTRPASAGSLLTQRRTLAAMRVPPERGSSPNRRMRDAEDSWPTAAGFALLGEGLVYVRAIALVAHQPTFFCHHLHLLQDR